MKITKTGLMTRIKNFWSKKDSVEIEMTTEEPKSALTTHDVAKKILAESPRELIDSSPLVSVRDSRKPEKEKELGQMRLNQLIDIINAEMPPTFAEWYYKKYGKSHENG